ncbi:hypothetical protein MS3_00008432 [Schistosoma haematobium]|uniref:Uncharacterized protein n=1 Tax=Schistosoma haematobium TaxID=6185 RepID=A0A922IJY6_SCHHA|nr:hypothetical protein MS3_00008432 [Schistosoma haematobium]KAH9581235.1 hypothetical protein MS3_00008432 [Schistosoma haematobium]
MGSILSRFSSRKDEKSDTDSRSATTIRKRFSWRSNKKPTDVGGTSVNRSSTMPARTRLQPTEETPEDRKHDDIFDSEQDEKSYSKAIVKPNQNDDTSQHSSGQLEQHNVECAKKPIVCEIPGGKDEKQPIQISSTIEPENKDNMARTISTEEAELLMGHVLPNQENVSPHENITVSGTNSSLTHDNINFNHTEDLIVNKQQLQETLDHSINDSCLTMDQQEIIKDQNGFVDDTQHHFEDKTDLLKDDIHSEVVREEIKLEQNPPLYLSPEEKEEFVHQDIRRDNSTEQLNAEDDIIKQEGEENLSIEGSSHNEVMQSSPAVCFSRSNVVEYTPPEQTHLVDIDEQTYNQQTNNISNIQSSETVAEKDLIHEQIVQNELLECSAEPRPFHNLSNNEKFFNSELIDTDNKVNFVETENTLDNVISEHVEQKDAIQETMEKEFNESLINSGETKILSADEPPNNLNDNTHVEQTDNLSHHKNTEHEAPIDEEETLNELDKCLSQPGLTHDPMHSISPITTEPNNLNDNIHVEQTDNLSHHKNTEHEAPIDEEETLNELDKCLSQPGLTHDPMHSISPITTEPNNLNDNIHVEQTDNLSHHKNTEHEAPIDEEETLNELDKCLSQPGLTHDPMHSISPITTEPNNLNDNIHVEQTDNLSHHKNTEHEAPIDEEETLNELDKCLSQPGLTHDPMHSISPITTEPNNLNDNIHVEQTDNLSHHKNTEHEAPIDEEETLNELDKCLSQPGLTHDPMHSISPITTEPNNLNDNIHVEQTDNLSHHKNTEHEAPIDEEETLNELDKCLSQPGLTHDPMHSISPITTEPINLNDDMYVEQTENLSHSENMESINLNDDIRAEQTEYTSPSEYNVNNNVSTEKFIDTVVESSAEQVIECDFSSNESRFTSELVLSEENREATTDVDLEHPTEDIKTEDIHHKQANDTETLTTLEESVNLQNTMNSTHIDDEIDQHQILELSYNENHSDVPLNADTIDVITSENLHTNLISTNDVLKQQDVFNSMSMNDDNDIIKNLENSKNNEIHEFEDEAQSLVQSVLNNAKEFVFNENNFDNHYNSDNMNTNLNLTNNNNNDYLTTNNNSFMNEEDTIEMKQDITMKTSMEFDHSDLSELNNQLLKNTNDLAIA